MAKKVKKEEVKEVKEKTYRTALFNLGNMVVKVTVNVDDKTALAEVMEV